MLFKAQMHSPTRPIFDALASQLPASSELLWLPEEESAEAESWFASRGVKIDLQSRVTPPLLDLRWIHPSKEKFDAIWCGKSLTAFSLEDVQRVVASLFRGLKPKTGVLGLLYAEGQTSQEGTSTTHRYGETALAALLKQNGFAIQQRGELPRNNDKEKWVALIARRC